MEKAREISRRGIREPVTRLHGWEWEAKQFDVTSPTSMQIEMFCIMVVVIESSSI